MTAATASFKDRPWSKTAIRATEQKSFGVHLCGHALWLIRSGLDNLAVAILWIFDLGRAPATLLVSLEKALK